MPNSNRIGSRVAPYIRQDNTGLFQTPGPFIGIVKNNLDPTCAGRLQVYIPHYGGSDENDPGNWITVSYASPFRGQTRQRVDLQNYIDQGIDITNTTGEQENSFQSYGFWFVPPDLNGRVLCQFVNGDPSQGYWTACIQDSMDSHMIPGIGAVPAADPSVLNSGGYIWQPTGANAIPSHTMLQNYIQLQEKKSTEIPYRLPVSEPVLQNQATASPTTPSLVKMVPHVFQTRQLGIQGLAFDFIRGSTSASSVRENPSQVFGISTPGRLSSFANVALSTQVLDIIRGVVNSKDTAPLSSQNVDLKTQIDNALGCAYRTGGHQFVMDDGTIEGQDQGIRIRTTAGNQILMDDTNGQIYIINSSGTAWVELSPSGRIDVFGSNDISTRSEGNLNFHSDQYINMHAGKAYRVFSQTGIQFETEGELTTKSVSGLTLYDAAKVQIGSGGEVDVSGSSTNFNSGGSFNIQSGVVKMPKPTGPPSGLPAVSAPGSLLQNSQISVSQQSGTDVWWQTGTFKSICNRATAHEPWPNHEVNGIKTFTVAQGDATPPPVIRPQSAGTSSGVRGTVAGVTVTEADVASQPLTGPVCGLTTSETQALLAALGKRESGWPKNSPGRGGNTQWVLSNGGTGYFAVNQLGYTGKYQFGAPILDGVFLRSHSSNGHTTANAINNPANWIGFMGCHSAVDFMNNGPAQEAMIMKELRNNCSQLTHWGVITKNSTPEQIAGYLAVAHLVGTGGALTLYRLQNPGASLYGAPQKNYTIADANGTGATQYYALGSNAVQLSSSKANA
jgi:hypothetical protein